MIIYFMTILVPFSIHVLVTLLQVYVIPTEYLISRLIK